MREQDAQRTLLFAVRLACARKCCGEGLDASPVVCAETGEEVCDFVLRLSRGEKLEGFDA